MPTSLLISKGLQYNKGPPNMSSIVSSTSIHDNYATTSSPSSLRSPRVPISAHTKELVIITKRKNHTRIQTQAKRVSLSKRFLSYN